MMAGIAHPRRIVVGVDGEAASAAAVRWAVREAQLRRAVVHLVFARDDDRCRRAPYAPSARAPRPDDQAAERILAAAGEDAAHYLPPGLPPVSVIAELADGPPARALLARADGAELLVLGATRPAGAGAEYPPPAMGPVTRACLRQAPCPVVVVAAHRHAPGAPPHRQLSPASEAAAAMTAPSGPADRRVACARAPVTG